MEKFLRKFQYYIVLGLLAMMVLVVFLGSIELAIILVQEILEPPTVILLNIQEMFEIFGFFLMILIGLELIETMKVYLVDESVHVEIIFLVAIIAITRKVIVLDVDKLSPLTLVGIASIILALSVGYFILKKALNQKA